MKRVNCLRILTAMLCLVLALSMFVACNTGDGQGTQGSGTTAGQPGDTTAPGGEDGTTEGGSESVAPENLVSLNVSEYSVYISDTASDAEMSAATALIIAVQEKLGAEFKYTGSDFVSNPAEIDPNACEILIGATNRPESRDALNDLGDKVGFVVKKLNNKIVINASALGLMDEAVQYFITNFVDASANGVLSVPKDLAVANTDAGGVSLLKPDGTSRFNMIYAANLDTTSGSDQYDRVDYVVNFFMDLRATFLKVTGVEDIAFDTDAGSAKAEAYEVLLGDTNRPETRAFLETLKPNEYGYGVVGNKIVITGWSDLTIGKAIELFNADLSKYLVKTEEGKNLVMLESDRTVAVYDKWNIDLPLYNDGKLTKVVELFYDSYEAYYTETSVEAYKAYCESLLAQGYKVFQTNQIDKNVFGTYLNETTMIHVYYVDYLNAVRFITESRKTATLPTMEDPNKGPKVADLSFTMFDLDNKSGNFGNSFILTLEDGSFILHDGGGDKGGGKDREELWNLLNKLNQRDDGKIVVAAWIISHQHWDHCKNMIDMFVKYSKKVEIERIIYNVATESIYYNTRNPNAYVNSMNQIALNEGAEVIRPHTGQTVQVRNLTLEFFYTHEDIYPKHPYTFNNTGITHRFYVGEGENRQRFTILGDIEDVASDIICNMYSAETLKTDIMQVAHHGYGGTVELYACFKPTVVLWPQNQGSVDGQLKESATGYYPTINKSLINQKNVLMLVVADNGHQQIQLPVVGLGNNRSENYKNLVTVYEREDGVTSK